MNMARMAVKGGKCNCSPGRMILGAILMAIGVLIGIQGFVMQFNLGGAWDMNALGWVLGLYFVGILIFAAGKVVKGHRACPVHG